jgi:phage tail-like protein
MEEEFPIMAFYYEVEIDGNIIRCQEVSGLDVEIEHAPYRSCDSENFHVVQVPGMQKFSGTIVCKKGVIEDDEEFMEMLTEMMEEKEYYALDDKFDITIELFNAEGETVMAWNVVGCTPKKFTSPTLNSMENQIAYETMEFAYDSFIVSADGA